MTRLPSKQKNNKKIIILELCSSLFFIFLIFLLFFNVEFANRVVQGWRSPLGVSISFSSTVWAELDGIRLYVSQFGDSQVDVLSGKIGIYVKPMDPAKI